MGPAENAHVLRTNVGRAVVFLRRKAGWRQADLGIRTGLSRESVSRIERGQIGAVTVGTLTSVATALGASLNLELRWQGEQLDRLIDASHAALQESAVRQVRAIGWRSEVEVSFNWYGDRGRVDAVAFHEETGTLLIVEVKVRLGDVQDTLGKLDVKARLGPQIARQLGWPQPTRVVPCLLVADGRTARRIVSDHAALFARFNLRGRAARRWLAAPTPEPVTGVLLFEPLPDSHGVTTKRVVRRRSAPRGHPA
jgi:transcriptional regulator with XRE-family HTH domain